MSDLRSKVIRLAHSNPELRGELLPLLSEETSKSASDPDFDLRTFQKSIIKELGNFHKMNGKQRKHWKDTYASLLTLYNITFDKEHKAVIEDMLGDLKSVLLSKLNADKKNLEDDISLIGRMTAIDTASALSEVRNMKSKRGRNAAMYYLKNPKLR